VSSSSTKSFFLNLQPAPAWIAILGLIIFSAVCILGHLGSVLRLGFPVGAFAVGVFLYQQYPILYVGFTWWIWFLTPLIRRLIDYQSGWVDPSVVLLSPLLVTLVTFATFVRYFPKSYNEGGLPFILCFVSVFYAFLVGLIKNSVTTATLAVLGWLIPIFFGFHLFVNWRDYPSYRQNIQRTFLWGVLVMGIYGMWQYLVAPEWDRFWLRNVDTPVFGTPEPFGIRVWSTMNSPQPFAGMMMTGLLLLFSSQGNLRFLAAGAGYLAFLLSSARSAWLSWLVGLLIFMPSLKARLQMRLIISIMVAAVFVLPLTTIEPFSTAIMPRIESLSNVKDDTSYQERAAGYSVLLDLALSEFLGKGMGGKIENNNTGLGSNDSGILTMLFSLGWFGTIPYLCGMVLLFFKLFQSSEGQFDAFVSAARAIALGTFSQISLNVVMTGSLGLVLWGFAGIAMAAQKYYSYQRTTH